MKDVNIDALDLLNFSFFCFGGFLFKNTLKRFFFDIIMRKDGYMYAYHLIEKLYRKIKWIVILYFVIFFLLFSNLDMISLAMCLEYLYNLSANLKICYLSYKGFWLNTLWFNILSDISPALFSFFILRFARHLCCMPHSYFTSLKCLYLSFS